MLTIHPSLQLLNILFVMYVFYLGFQRAKILHFKQKASFKWKRHVSLGIIVFIIWIGGLLSGMTIVYFYWHGFLITKIHGKIGLLIGLLSIFGLSTGLYMNYNKKKRKFFPIIHGLSNLLALILALTQIWSGWLVYSSFVLGY